MPDNPPVYLLLANIHIQRKDLPALQKDLDQYLRLSPSGPEADRARKTLDQVQEMLKAKSQAEENDEEDDQSSAAKSAGTAPKKETPPPVEPDTSGLPSLPPPTAGNP